MKTIGEILRSVRLDRGHSIEQLSQITKIDTKYILAIEENDFSSLPSATFTKGFVRNLAISLNKDPDEWVALLRRDFQKPNTTSVVNPIRHKRKVTIFTLLQSQSLLFAIGVIVFLSYLAFQYRAVITPPSLEIISPADDAIAVSPLLIEGRTDSGSTVVVNEDLKITPDSSGNFQLKITLSPGHTDIIVSVTNRFARTTKKIIPVTILSQ